MPHPPVVLIVDDDDIFLTLTESMVKMIGFPVMRAQDGIEALVIFQEHADAIGCVVLDLQMPRMDGITTFQQLRKMSKDTQVIIVSGYRYEANREQLEPLHPAGYLKKPISYRALSDLLAACLEHVNRRAQQRNHGRASGTFGDKDKG